MGRSRSTPARPYLPGAAGPGPGELLDVSLHRAGVPLTARVLEAGTDRLVLAPPVDVLGAACRLVDGEDLDLLWADAGDLVGIPVAVERTGVTAEGGWSAVVVGPPQRVQRRDAVRVPLHVRAEVVDGARPPGAGTDDLGADADAGTSAGPPEITVLDLSESGARCLVDPLVLQLERGQSVHLRLPVDGLGGPLRARVVHRRFRPGTRHADVGLRFEGLGEADADTLRRHVFAQMRRLRHRGDV